MKELILCECCKVKIELKEICPICNFNQVTKKQEVITHIEQNIITLGWKKLILRITFLMGLIPAVLSIAIDLLQNDMVSWSKLVVLSIGIAWLCLFVILVIGKYPFILGLSLLVITNVFLFLLNYIQQDDWFVRFGLLFSLGISLMSYACFMIIGKVKDNFLKIIAVFLLGISLICIFIDILYYWGSMGQIKITWSLIVFGATLPLALLLLYLSNHKKIINGWMQY